MKKLLLLALLLPLTVLAVESDYVLVIKDHQFQPAELSVPSGKKIKIVIENRDASPEEFESHSLNREKLIAANGSVSIYIGPLTVGRYPFYGEFNEATAQGVIIAK
ncbi:MAG: cupredoxin domain-containing protein [Methylophilaceae bacterium]|nr:cupredoxin domain-containing protein [Methylophilales bacterium]